MEYGKIDRGGVGETPITPKPRFVPPSQVAPNRLRLEDDAFPGTPWLKDFITLYKEQEEYRIDAETIKRNGRLWWWSLGV